MRATEGVLRLNLCERGISRWPIRECALASIALATILVAFLLQRRFSGAIDAPLARPPLAATVLVLTAWAIVASLIWSSRWTNLLLGIVLLAFAVALSYPGERAIDWIAWIGALGALVALEFARAPNASTSKQASPRRDTDASPTPHVVQQITRSRTAAGHDAIHGMLLAEFAAGERAVTLYVAFCPPFELLPQVEVESSLDAKVVQAFHHGAQIEVRRSAAKSAASASVEFYASELECDEPEVK